jgi:thioredoxin 1
MSQMNNYSPIILVNDNTFQKQVIENSLPVIVVFEKCCWGTAQIMKPILEKIAFDFADKIIVYKYSMEQNSVISEQYKIENSTTVLLFNKGDVIYKTGVISKMELQKIINSLLNETLKTTG